MSGERASLLSSICSADLCNPHPQWEKVAATQAAIDRLAAEVYSLPIVEFRKTPYRPPPLPSYAPVSGSDIKTRYEEICARDGTSIRVRIYEPLHVSGRHPLFFNVHGGGWTVGVPETEEIQNRLIAYKNNAVVVSVDYRKAPEYPFPYALNDSFDALLWCKHNAKALGIDQSQIVLGGGSAGANVCAVLAQIARDDGIEGIIGQVLNIPVTCHPNHFPKSRLSEPWSYKQNAQAPIVDASRMRIFWNNYLPDASPDPHASPLLSNNLTNLCPAFQIAGMDPLRDDGLAYADALAENGVDVTVRIWAGMPHAFYVYSEMECSIEYFKTMTDWLDRKYGRASR